MIISIIAAMDENGGIGYENQIPWHLPADLARFKELTMGHLLVAGRKTFQSIGSALPGRQMIVLTRNPEFEAQDCLRAESLNEAISMAEEAEEIELFIIGGAEIYEEALSIADHLYLTIVHTSVEVDTYFPEIDGSKWYQVCEEDIPADEKNSLATTFKHLVKSVISDQSSDLKTF